MRTLRFFIKYSVADPDLQIRGGGGHPDPEIRGGPVNFFGLQASFWSKNKGVGASTGSATSISHQTAPSRSNTKILDIALAWGLRTKLKKTVLNHITYRFSLR